MNIKTEHIRRLKNGDVKGHFIMDDRFKSKVKFDCTKAGWNQWNAPADVLRVTMSRVEELQNEVYGI